MNNDKTFPGWLKIWWIGSAPFALALTARIAWEKTILTWQRGPQMVGFSLWHIHPLFAIAGYFCCLSLDVMAATSGDLLREAPRVRNHD